MPPYTEAHSHGCDGPSSPSLSPTSRRPLHCPSKPVHHPPKSASRSNVETHDGLLQHAATELEAMRRPPSPQKRDSSSSISSNDSDGSNDSIEEMERSFPPACLHLLHSLPGNSRCHDCGTASPAWASVSYGITLCLQCSGKHRGLGVNCSKVKSLALDSWKRREILCMLEGGNEQLNSFFDRHQMGGRPTAHGSDNRESYATNVGLLDRYRTKAASFYRQHLTIHAKQLADGGSYEGREASRRSCKQRKAASSGKTKSRKKSREQPRQLPTVTEKDPVEPACGAVGA
eukprot:CAMPEP_0172540222 /NCGR_PEP_ID=MMETSP1067-20121228/11293_1 /TAXON_ID=265564 ORGANISM="Thalassiosira punctigera, Strain Tpunct2005C2" /NCGR_SAMPLE_ID=MMETSP1067 /ASSEMBLY_ACC=CAM_ASM_000444 /LENGTH=287 /DNA_ID=CAMNT_0013326057 /DNA_START=304 /DNA_END=1167 /DNA_ORIENTATION=+